MNTAKTTTTATLWYVAPPYPVNPVDPVGALSIRSVRNDSAAEALARGMFADKVIVPAGSGPLADIAPGEVGIGCFPGVTVVSGDRFVFPRPSAASLGWIRPTPAERTYYTAVGPVRAWGAFAVWDRAVLRRSFSATRVHIIEDAGLPAVWERGFWAGEHPIEYPLGVYPSPQSLPFDPEVFAAEAARQWFGIERGDVAVDRFRVCEPGSVHSVHSVHAGRVRRSGRHSVSKKSPIQAKATPAASP